MKSGNINFQDPSGPLQACNGTPFPLTYEYSVQKFRSIYSQIQGPSLDEAMISWQGRLKFRTYNPGKIRYGDLARTVCEAVSGYICNMEIYWAEGKKLEDTMVSLLDRNLGQNHHIYQDSFYNWDQLKNC
jgi:hypothetical protein